MLFVHKRRLLMHVLAVMAHPDDAEIFLGGSLLAWREMKVQTGILIATDGRFGGKGDPEVLASIRKAEAQEAADILDARLVMLGLEDGALSRDPGGLVRCLQDFLIEAAPDLIVTHALNDYHADHRALAAAALQAAGLYIPVAHCDTLSGLGASPRYWIDITDHAPRKAQAILRHRTQDPPRLIQLAETLSRQRAAQCGDATGHAEALSFAPRYPFADIRGLLPQAPGIRPLTERIPS